MKKLIVLFILLGSYSYGQSSEPKLALTSEPMNNTVETTTEEPKLAAFSIVETPKTENTNMIPVLAPYSIIEPVKKESTSEEKK